MFLHENCLGAKLGDFSFERPGHPATHLKRLDPEPEGVADEEDEDDEDQDDDGLFVTLPHPPLPLRQIPATDADADAGPDWAEHRRGRRFAFPDADYDVVIDDGVVVVGRRRRRRSVLVADVVDLADGMDPVFAL